MLSSGWLASCVGQSEMPASTFFFIIFFIFFFGGKESSVSSCVSGCVGGGKEIIPFFCLAVCV